MSNSSFFYKFLNIFRKILPSVPLQEKVNLARNLAVTVKSGLPLIGALNLIRAQVSSQRLKKIIDNVVKQVNNGKSLAQSLEPYNYIFNDFFISMVRLGETSGSLSSGLLYLAAELKKQKELQNKVRAALVYPCIILIMTVGITIFLTLFVFPKILPILLSLGVQLPPTTRFLIAALSFLHKYWHLLLGGIVLFVFSSRVVLTFEKIRFLFHWLALLVPFLNRIIINVTLANFTRSLAVLLKSGTTNIDALQIVKGTINNYYYRHHINKLINTVRKGEEMGHYFMKYPKLFPPIFRGMIQVGENTGNLEENLNYLSEYYEGEVNELVRNLTTVLEPVLLLLMGAIVGFVVLSIITPIYKMTQRMR